MRRRAAPRRRRLAQRVSWRGAVLHIHRAERADGLVDALGALLADPPDDPFAPEVVAVPTRGMERWLTQRLSARLGATPGRADGVCANVAFPSPRRLVGDAVARGVGHRPGRATRGSPSASVWPLLEVVERALDEPWLRVLAATSAPARTRRRRHGARGGSSSVRHVAELFDRYACHRPGDAARLGERATTPTTRRDAAGRRALAAAAVAPAARRASASRPRRRASSGACARLRAEPGLVDLPARLTLFGLTRLPAATLQVLGALAEQPRRAPASRCTRRRRCGSASPALDAAAAPSRAAPTTRRAPLPRNRLLASWGRDVRELQLVLGARRRPRERPPPSASSTRRTLLDRLQADVRADRRARRASAAELPATRGPQHAGPRLPRAQPPGRGAARRDPAPARPTTRRSSRATSSSCAPTSRRSRRSSRRRSAPGRSRTARTPTPLPTRAAPPGPARPPRRPLAAADQPRPRRRRRAAGPRERPGGRVGGPRPRRPRARAPALRPRRRRPRAHRGLGRRQRHPLGPGCRAPRARSSSTRSTPAPGAPGLDRVLLGVAMAEETAPVGGVLPLDDVDSGAIDLAGRLAELVDRLDDGARRLGAAQPIGALGGRASPQAPTPSPRRRRATPGSAPSCIASSTTSSPRDRRRRGRRDAARAAGGARAARRAPRRADRRARTSAPAT